jgi:Family of unknown function (DUF5906)
VVQSKKSKKNGDSVNNNGNGALRERTPEFEAACNERLRQVAEKYAWTAQQGGIILRRDPLKLQPYKDYVFDRISRREYGFRFINKRGRTCVWYPTGGRVLAGLDEPEGEFGLIMAERIEFLPGKPEVTYDSNACRVLNLWRPPPWSNPGNAREPKVFLEHLAYLLDGDNQGIEHVLNFLAHLVQKPAHRIGHALLITSRAKGIGKSTLGAIVRKLVGEQNSRVAQTKDLKSQFDGWLVGKLVVQVDEIYEAGNWELANKLKPLITEPSVSVNMKYGPQLEIENYARFLLFSNHTAPLDLEEGDRRYFVFESKAQPRDQTYYDNLHRFAESHADLEGLYAFLMKRDLSAFNSHRSPPLTVAKQSIIEASGHPLRIFILEAVASGHLLQTLGPEFSFVQLQLQLHKDGYGPHSKNVKELGDALEAAGAEKVRVTKAGKKVRLWRIPATPVTAPNPEEMHTF